MTGSRAAISTAIGTPPNHSGVYLPADTVCCGAPRLPASSREEAGQATKLAGAPCWEGDCDSAAERPRDLHQRPQRHVLSRAVLAACNVRSAHPGSGGELCLAQTLLL